jgi:hypothetical protein
MVDEVAFDVEFFSLLTQKDEQITACVAAEMCPKCCGPLHRSDYERKPAGALIAPAGEASVTRFSLCCGREGCRKRATPPSLRFLGRRVYLGVVVILASLVGQARAKAAELRRQTGVPPRTVRRWLSWWQGLFLSTEVFVAIRARLIGVDVDEVPSSIVEQLPGSRTSRMLTMLSWLLPLTTGSVADGSRFLRDVA